MAIPDDEAENEEEFRMLDEEVKQLEVGRTGIFHPFVFHSWIQFVMQWLLIDSVPRSS
jgi:hypothetical protein